MKIYQLAKIKDENNTCYIIGCNSNESDMEILNKGRQFYGHKMVQVIHRTDVGR